MALGQALELPLSSSLLEPLNWRAMISSSALEGSGAAIGEAAAKAVRNETVKNFMMRFGGVVVDTGKIVRLLKSERSRANVVSVEAAEIRGCLFNRGEVEHTYISRPPYIQNLHRS